ncbi:MAG: O-antigen ligase family protein [Bacteroidota bacterium]
MFNITKESLFFAALILVAVTLPVSNLLVNTISIWLMIAVWLMSSPIKEKIRFLRSNKLIWLFSSLFLMYAIGLIYGNFKLGLFEIEKRLSLLIFPIVLGTAPKISSKQFKIVLLSFAVSCIIISLLCLIDTFYRNYSQGIVFFSDQFYTDKSYGIIFAHNNSWLFSYENLTKNYGFHPSYFSVYAVFSIFILLFVGFRNESISKFEKLSWGLAVIFLIIFIFLLASRIGLISLLILSVFSLLFYSYKKRKLLYGFIVTLLFIFSISYALQFFIPIKEKFEGLVTNGTEYSPYRSSERLELWGSSLKVIKDNFLVGVGTGSLQPVLQCIYKNDSKAYCYQYNSHNQFLDIAATLGSIGLIFFILSLFYPIYLCYKKKNYLYAIFILLFMFISFVECPLAVQKGVVWYAFFNSLFAFHSFNFFKN